MSPGSSSAIIEPGVIEISTPSDNRSSESKASVLKQKEVVSHEVIDVDMDEDHNEVIFIKGNIVPNKKRRGTLGISADGSMDMILSTKKVESNKKGKEVAILSSMLSGAQVDSSKNIDPGTYGFFDLDNDDSEDYYLALQSHFDKMDVPAGIEAPIPQLPEIKKKASVTSHAQSEASQRHMMADPWWPYGQSASNYSSLQAQSNPQNNPSFGPHKIQYQNMPYNYPSFSMFSMDTAHPLGVNTPTYKWHKTIMKNHPGVEDANALFLPECPDMYGMDDILGDLDDGNDPRSSPDMYGMEDMLGDQNDGNGPRSSSLVGSSSIMANLNNEEVLKRYESFKKFDTVLDHSDHFYATHKPAMKQPPKNWAKKIQEEWRILEKDLPDTIFVRVYESRMDLLRAVIIGAEGTPYHDGLFFFDVCFPSSYPNTPPLVHYRSGGLHINPNLYDCGKVCLSLLNTWAGSQNEKWVPNFSTMLQVLVSIQGLILNTKPYFNEPGLANLSGSVHGEHCSIQYNENILILSLKTMVYAMKKPPKNFEDLVIGHFRNHVRDIMMACKAYTEGVQVGCLVKGGVQDVDEGNKSCSAKFKNDVASFIKILVGGFKKIGAKEAEEFLYLSKKISPLPESAPTFFEPNVYPSFTFSTSYKHKW